MKYCSFVLSIIIIVLCSGYSVWANEISSKPNDVVVYTIVASDYSFHATQGAATKIVESGKNATLLVTSKGRSVVKEPILLNLGWMKVQPNTTYRVRVRMRAKSLESNANVYLMIREHEGKGRPFKPYHKTSVHNRKISTKQTGKWIKQVLSFTTRKDTHMLNGAIVIAKLKGTLELTSFELLNNSAYQAAAHARAEAAYHKMMDRIRAKAATRKRIASRTLVFSRAQMKYGLGRNYYHRWTDRPLFINRAYRVPHKYVTPLGSYKRILQEVKKYDIDGLAFFPATKGRMGMFQLQQKAGVKGVDLMPALLPGSSLKTKIETVRRALASPSTPRINGKIVITSYASSARTPAQWKHTLEALHKHFGDKFVFLAALTAGTGLKREFEAGQPISKQKINKVKAKLRAYLNVCDGIYFFYPPAMRKPNRTFNAAFYSDIFIPIWKSVLAEPKYRNKYFGLSAYKCHLNPVVGNSFLQNGTKTLRSSFQAATDAKPDVIVMPEWDEENENTSIRPTLYSSTTTERILRYYMSRIRGIAPTPVPGDNISIPNLIISTRKFVTLGQNTMIELLNVPDSTKEDRYTVQLTLLNSQGHVVRRYEPVSFDAARLQVHHLYLATSTIPNVRALVPILTISDYKNEGSVHYTGFHQIHVRATWNFDDLYVEQPLRMLLKPKSVTFGWAKSQKGNQNGTSLVLTGSVISPEKLALVEVMGDDDVVYAVDPRNKFYRDNPNYRLIRIEYRSINKQQLDGSITLTGATGKWLSNGSILHQPPTTMSVHGDRITLKSPVWLHQHWIRLAIPASKIDGAKLSFNFKQGTFSVPVKKIFKEQIISKAFVNGLHFTLSAYHKQIDMPFDMDKKKAMFRVRIWPGIKTEQYHLLLTAVDGKTYRTPPILLPDTAKLISNKQSLRIYSQWKHEPETVQVAAYRIPNLIYDFNPDHGAVLWTKAGRPFLGTLGGYTNAVTGRGAHAGLFRRGYSKSIKHSNPKWIKSDGRWCLKFNGISTFLTLPREILPRRGSYTIQLSIKPTSSQNQTILRNRVYHHTRGLTLKIREGKLYATCPGYRFKTKLPVPVDNWSAITVRFDFQHITFTVNGDKASFPLKRAATNIGYLIIGDPVGGQGFTGLLRSIQITHNST